MLGTCLWIGCGLIAGYLWLVRKGWDLRAQQLLDEQRERDAERARVTADRAERLRLSSTGLPLAVAPDREPSGA
jgi:hypothetical protein